LQLAHSCFHESSVPFKNSRVWHTLSPYTSNNSSKHSVVSFQFHKKFHIDALLDFHSSHECGRTQHGHTQNKAQGHTNWYRETSPVLFDSRSFKVNYLSLVPHSYNFPQQRARSPVI
jgi:hypothetical protein